MNILIAEDDFFSRRLMKEYLSKYGNCDIATNGYEAVEMFRLSLNEGNPYDVIFLDIMMPEKDGHQALREIREHEINVDNEGNDSVKIIMTSGLRDFENIDKAFKEHCEGYLEKPFEFNRIDALLSKLELIE